MSLSTTLKCGIAAQLIGSALQGGSPSWVGKAADDAVLATGTGASQADLIYSANLTIAASGNTTLDLTGGTLKDPLGNALVFAKVKAIYIKADSGNTNDVILGNAASNPFLPGLAGTTPTVAVKPGGRLLLAAPVGGWAAVVADTNDIIKLANSSGTTGVTFDIDVVGTSA